MLDLMDKATADGKCLRCGRPVYPKADGGFTHDPPVRTVSAAQIVSEGKSSYVKSAPKPAPAAEDPQGPEQHNQPA